ncbi:OmpA family protein [Mucilaginibacter sp. BT774]|uniref:OmpA family protein n=1 Tax=Mucilaginibacter sp. BT774 TaxID=3062276 RepID=UPI00267508C2|nr:OmpA family protein [Mucilaginibacter sp. BT774]MDO3628170.1 OmpA family protein [Mucilaginibacter sp. BT774]
MRKILTISFFVTSLLCLWIPAKAQYVIKQADTQYELFDYVKAIDLYEQAYRQKQTLHAAERLASCYYLVQNYKEAESWYAIASAMQGSDPSDLLNYARALQNNSKYLEAKDAYNKYAAMNNNVTQAQRNTWLSSCDSAMIWMKSPEHVNIDNQKTLNSQQSDWGAIAYNDGVVFASDRPSSPSERQKGTKPFLKFDGGHKPDKKVYGWTGNGYLRLYYQKENPGDVQAFPVTIGSNYHNGPASFTANGDEMYFTLTRIPKKLEYEKGRIATINVEIYSCKKDSAGNWSAPVAFRYNNLNSYSVGDPYISHDGNILLFVSNMPGGMGGTDIYYCRRDSAGQWGKPANIESINTPGNERTPSFGDDNSFYFSSDGRVGMGGLDIYKSKWINGKVTPPVDLHYPFNSPQDDFAYLATTPTSGYFSSNRPDGMGSDDIYKYTVQKTIIFALEGTAYDKDTKEPLSKAVISLTSANGSTVKAQTDVDGRYRFSLDTNSNYNLLGEKTGYRNDGNSTVTTVGLAHSTTIRKDRYFEKIKLNVEIVLKDIYYDFDKANIRPDAARELDKLVKIMQDNPTIWIELGSHTDSRGGDAYNQWLSQRRANSAVQYIIDRGINKNRITAKGYGESRLVNGCSNGVPCSPVEHQANRRTEFHIVKY